MIHYVCDVCGKRMNDASDLITVAVTTSTDELIESDVCLFCYPTAIQKIKEVIHESISTDSNSTM
jgi:hypothetical protein